jgi:nucleoside-diphosphate-sugar epimerase
MLITGANGFIGSWLCIYFAVRDYEVIALVREKADTSRIAVIPGIRVLRASTNQWGALIDELIPAVVIAADWNGVATEKRNSEVQYLNVTRWKELATAAKRVGVEHFCVFGSQAELGTDLSGITELSPDKPVTDYGKAKCKARDSLFEIFDGGKTDLKWIRVFSVFGPLDNGSWLIPSCIRAFLANDSIELTRGEQKWNYLYVLDLCSAVEVAISQQFPVGILQIASNSSLSIRQAVDSIQIELGVSGLANFGAIPYTINQIMEVSPNLEKAQSLGWVEKYSWVDALRSTIHWHQSKIPLPVREFGISGEFNLAIYD